MTPRWKAETSPGKRRPITTMRDERRQTIGTPEDAARHVRAMVESNPDQEGFYVLCIDVRSGLIDCRMVALGTVCGVDVHPREVFRPAISVAAAGIVLAHNHPSGVSTPSEEDIELTRRLKKAGDILGIPVVDHVVVTMGSYSSMAGEGLL